MANSGGMPAIPKGKPVSVPKRPPPPASDRAGGKRPAGHGVPHRPGGKGRGR
jgi:hypothetical protein